MDELQPNVVIHGRHFVRHIGICNPICVRLLQVMSCVILRNLKKNGVSISNRFPGVHKRDTHTHTHDDSIRRNAMRCISFKNTAWIDQFWISMIEWSEWLSLFALKKTILTSFRSEFRKSYLWMYWLKQILKKNRYCFIVSCWWCNSCYIYLLTLDVILMSKFRMGNLPCNTQIKIAKKTSNAVLSIHYLRCLHLPCWPPRPDFKVKFKKGSLFNAWIRLIKVSGKNQQYRLLSSSSSSSL